MPSEKVLCACGCYIARNGINIHKKTKKHLRLLENNCQLTIEEVMKKMEELEEKIDDISSNEYLLECNRLKSIYDRLKRTQREEIYDIDISRILIMLFG
jgi:hypothetical protein